MFFDWRQFPPPHVLKSVTLLAVQTHGVFRIGVVTSESSSVSPSLVDECTNKEHILHLCSSNVIGEDHKRWNILYPERHNAQQPRSKVQLAPEHCAFAQQGRWEPETMERGEHPANPRAAGTLDR